MASHKPGPPTVPDASRSFIVERLAGLEPLRLPAYRVLLLNTIFAEMAVQARLMAQAWLILALTNSDAWVGTVAGLPALLAAAAALLGGVLADRFNRHRMLMGIQLPLAGIALFTAVLVVTNVVQVWQLLVLAFAVALFQVSGFTASLSLIADLVPKQQLFSANALYSASGNLAVVIGPALAGIIIAQFGVELAFSFSAALFLCAALTATCIQAPPQHGGRTATSVWQDLKGGIQYVAQTPVLQWLLLLGLTVVAVGVWFTLVPRYARDVLDAGATGYGAILSARGVGGLVGMITLLAAANVRRLAAVLVACAAAFAALVIAFAFSTSLLTATAIGFGLGMVFIWWPATLRTAFQFAGSDEMRGRVMSLFALVGQLLTLGWFVGGLLSEAFGPQAAMISVALICVLVNVVAYLRSPALRAIGQ